MNSDMVYGTILIAIIVNCVILLFEHFILRRNNTNHKCDEMEEDSKRYDPVNRIPDSYRAKRYRVCICNDIYYKWGEFSIRDFTDEITPSDKHEDVDEKIRDYNALVIMIRMKMFEAINNNHSHSDVVIILVDLKTFLKDNTRGMEILYGDMGDAKIEHAFLRLMNGDTFSHMYRANEHVLHNGKEFNK